MPITYPLTLPSAPLPRSVEWIGQSTVSASRSGYTFGDSVYDWTGQARSVRLEYPPMRLATAKLWQAWAHKMNGSQGTFYLSDTVGKAGLGTVVGTPLVDGAGQTTDELVTDGWTGGDNVKAGDWISIANRLYTILADATESGGAMTVTLWPRAQGPADDAPISYGAAAQGIFRLDEWPSFQWGVDRQQGSITLLATEEL